MLNRLPLPSQLDRVIITGSLLVGALVTPFIVALIVLLALNQITGPELVFWLMAGITVLAALNSVLSKNLVHAALSLVIVALGVAGIFLLLASEFLAIVQVMVYGGGVAILVIFGLMLTNATEDPIVTDGSQKPFAFGVGIALAGVITAAMLDADWNTGESVTTGIREIGTRLFRDYGVPFEIASLVLIVALVGAIAVARRDQDEEEVA